jgi:hypothetical protein
MRWLAIACLVVGACGARAGETLIGLNEHAPYPGKPSYLTGVRVAPTAWELRTAQDRQSNPLQVVPPNAVGEDEDKAAPRQGGGSFTVALPNPAPLPNRVSSPEQNWQPAIVVPTHPIVFEPAPPPESP